MVDPTDTLSLFLDTNPGAGSIQDDVWEGLNDEPRWLPSKYFYDAEGSRLFDRICELDEYYPTRTETRILEQLLPDLSTILTGDIALLEYGSGSSTKTRVLLEALPGIRTYIPIDISREHLLAASADLQSRFPTLEVLPVCADYGRPIPFPWDSKEVPHLADADRMVFFPGSTIGNFTHPVARAFLRRMGELVGPGGRILIGVDLVKGVDVLHAAYNDAMGVTAEFNRNILSHINARLGSDFRPEAFKHRAFFDETNGRIEMNLIAGERMKARLPQGSVQFEEGDVIRTEYSHKYTLDGFSSLASEAGLEVEQVWTDDRNWFSVQLLIAR